MRDERGQGTVEYAGLVLLVALVLAAAVAALVASGIGPLIAREIRCAILTVAGRPCEPPESASGPCVVASEQLTRYRQATLAFVRVGSSEIVLRERLADGSVRLTLVEEREGGLTLGVGAGVRVRWGERSFAAGAELRAAALAGQGDGRSWVAPDGPSADRLLERIRLAAISERPTPSIPNAPGMAPGREEVAAPEPDATFRERTSRVSLQGYLRDRAASEAGGAEAYGERVDRRTGRRTLYVRSSAALGGRVGLGRGVVLEARGEAEERYGITFDREGRPVDLVVLSVLDVAGAAALPRRLATAAGALGIPLEGRRHVEVEQRLDLTAPANAAIVERFLAGGRSAVGVRMAARVLASRLDTEGSASVRSYATEEDVREVGGSVRAGVGAGGQAGRETATARLLASVRRAPGGGFEADPACSAA